MEEQKQCEKISTCSLQGPLKDEPSDIGVDTQTSGPHKRKRNQCASLDTQTSGPHKRKRNQCASLDNQTSSSLECESDKFLGKIKDPWAKSLHKASIEQAKHRAAHLKRKDEESKNPKTVTGTLKTIEALFEYIMLNLSFHDITINFKDSASKIHVNDWFRENQKKFFKIENIQCYIIGKNTINITNCGMGALRLLRSTGKPRKITDRPLIINVTNSLSK